MSPRPPIFLKRIVALPEGRVAVSPVTFMPAAGTSGAVADDQLGELGLLP